MILATAIHSATTQALDATSLERLHDIVMPARVPWWPPAPGWFVLVAFLFIVCAAVAASLARRVHANRYRRQALAALRGFVAIDASHSRAAVLESIAILLKRVALSAYARNEVASLTGTQWLAFLQRTGGRFDDRLGRLFITAPYDADVTDIISAEDLRRLISQTEWWIAHHAVPAIREGARC